MARNALRSVRPALLLALAFILTACTTPEIIRETPQPSPTATATLVPIETPEPPTSTSVAAAPTRTIERIAFATTVGDDDAPEDERAVIPEEAERFYICIQASNVPQGSRFQAIWFENGQIIGQSEKLALEDSAEATWFALQYRPIGKLNPALDHAVELFVDDDQIERLTFRVGVGNPADAIAAAGFTTGFDALGKAISPQTHFHVDTPQLTLKVRISNQVDPTGMLFSTLWYRGSTQIAQQAPDGTTNDPRRLDFTFTPSSKLPPGNYRVALLLNGTEVRSIPFVMTTEVPPTPNPRQTPTPDGVQIVDLVIASRINNDSRQPLDGPLSSWSDDPGGVANLWVAVEVRDLARSDTLVIEVEQDGDFYGEVTLRETALAEGWLAGRVELEVPDDGDDPYTYQFTVLVNDEPTVDTTLELDAD
jgi:hypothetical protein